MTLPKPLPLCWHNVPVLPLNKMTNAILCHTARYYGVSYFHTSKISKFSKGITL